MGAVTRKVEGNLLLYTIYLLMLGLFLLKLVKGSELTWQALLFGGLTGLSFLGVHLVLRIWGHRGDLYLFPLAAVLVSLGMVFLFRLSPAHGVKQFYWLAIAELVFLAVVRFPSYEKLADYKYLYIIFGLLALLATIFFGRVIGGARNWLDFGGFRIQPAEFVKLILVIFLASYLETKRELLSANTGKIWGFGVPDYRHLAPLLVMWGMSLILLVFQKDLGSALIFFSTFLSMIYIATSRPIYVAVGGGLFIFGAGLTYLFFSHVQTRVQIWLNPWPVAETKGFQIVQSLFAIGSGGLYGSGLGKGFPQFIPAVHTDFIFSALAEELGLLGSVAIIIIYLLFLYRGFKIALKTPDDFGKLLASGLTVLMSIQVFIILGGVTKLVPLTGITLPYVSYGGSSLVANYILLALLMNISHKVESHEQ